MNKLTNILSTKTLSNESLDILDVRLFNIIALNFITITPLPYDQSKVLSSSNHWIISTKNTLNILLNDFSLSQLKDISFYCVGDKTSKLIADNNLNSITSAPSSVLLAQKIVEDYPTTNFTFICGEMRRNELDRILKNRKIRLNEFNIYSTTLSPSEIKTPIDGLLFFSPSAIQSYVLKNSIATETLFCIGNTTATEAKKHSANIIIAENQTFESVIESVKNHYT